MLHRSLARDYETLPTSSEATIHVAMVDNDSKRTTDEATATWQFLNLAGQVRPLIVA